MSEFSAKRLPVARDTVAPDRSDVRILLGLAGGGMAHFELAAGTTSVAVVHRTIEEIWYFPSGRGEMWRKQGEREEIVPVDPGVCITIPLGAHFQFRAFGHEPLAALGVTMPPWPGPGEACAVEGMGTGGPAGNRLTRSTWCGASGEDRLRRRRRIASGSWVHAQR